LVKEAHAGESNDVPGFSKYSRPGHCFLIVPMRSIGAAPFNSCAILACLLDEKYAFDPGSNQRGERRIGSAFSFSPMMTIKGSLKEQSRHTVESTLVALESFNVANTLLTRTSSRPVRDALKVGQNSANQ